jgi:hypothetical protein
MLYYITKDYLIDSKNNKKTTQGYGYCYFCELWSYEMYIIHDPIFHKNIKFLCNKCVTRWDSVKNSVENITDKLFKIDIKNNSNLKYDAIFHLNEKEYVIYSRLIIPREKYEYFKLVKYNIRNIYCDLCCDYTSSIYDLYDHRDYKIFLICKSCINHALKIFVNNNYKKYLLINTLGELNDTRSLIVKDLIMLNKISNYY